MLKELKEAAQLATVIVSRAFLYGVSRTGKWVSLRKTAANIAKCWPILRPSYKLQSDGWLMSDMGSWTKSIEGEIRMQVDIDLLAAPEPGGDYYWRLDYRQIVEEGLCTSLSVAKREVQDMAKYYDNLFK